MTKVFDIAIIGGGINGCGCAADAALRGLSVVLCEKDDLASQTSSSSTKLIHGGLRYLEQFEFSLVKKALDERQTLLQIAPHLVQPLPFILPQSPKQRSAWIIKIGLFLYDHLSQKNQLPRSTKVTRDQNPLYFRPLVSSEQNGFKFYDCKTDDARLTITNALQAQQHGADIRLHTAVIQAEIKNNLWHLSAQTKHQAPTQIRARSLINAAGPWVEGVNQLLQIPNTHQLSLVKGSHLIIKQLYNGDHAYALQHTDNRIIFTIPYFGHTLVGTTEISVASPTNTSSINDSEIDYLITFINQHFTKKTTRHDIVTSFSGIRPLLSEPNKNAHNLTRDYFYHFSNFPAPAVTIYGGKITTYRILAEKVIDSLRIIFPDIAHSKTSTTPLPGAKYSSTSFQDYIHQAYQSYSWLEKSILDHYLQTYGTCTEIILDGCGAMKDLGEHFISNLYQREVDYLIKYEWVTAVDDILWRRTKFGLLIDEAAKNRLQQYMKPHHAFGSFIDYS